MASTLNSKLGVPSNVSGYSDFGKGVRANKFYTNSNGTLTSLVLGLKQLKGNKAYYQVQWRWHYRYTGAQALSHGADWTDFNDWRTPVAIAATTSHATAIAAGSTTAVNDWERPNFAPNQKGDYLRISTAGVTLASTYDAVSYQVRARVYDPASNKHGPWAYSESIKVFRAAEVAGVTLRTDEDGALVIDYNYKWDRGRALIVTIVKDSTGRNLLRDTFKRTPQQRPVFFDLTDPEPPPASPYTSGYHWGENKIPVSALKRKMEPNEVIRLNAYLATYDGARTYLPKPLTVNSYDAELSAPRIAVAKDNARGVLQVFAYKTDADDDLDSVGCCVTWSYNGKDYTALPETSRVDTTINSTTTPVGRFWFVGVPVGVTLAVTVVFRNSFAYLKRTYAKTTLGATSTAYLNPASGAQTNTAAAFANMSLTVSSTPPVTIELPFGRTAPFAAYGKGETTTVTFTATIAETARSGQSDRSTWQYWNAIRTNPGLYVLRLPDGQMYQLAVQSIESTQERDGLRTVTLVGTEVS